MKDGMMVGAPSQTGEEKSNNGMKCAKGKWPREVPTLVAFRDFESEGRCCCCRVCQSGAINDGRRLRCSLITNALKITAPKLVRSDVVKGCPAAITEITKAHYLRAARKKTKAQPHYSFWCAHWSHTVVCIIIIMVWLRTCL